ncbi:hypothetical protein [Bernardetia sp.]|uniref:hypothetical protein n=1 Tax=Bernardetia sp. TaxID=1937974 RepID=UPI0025BBA97B|nr:hypothetical protein [Bernardetia sp.]
MDYEKAYKKFKTAWERLGGTVNESEEEIDIDENQVVTSILSDENRTKTLVDEAAQKRESLLINKLQKQLVNLGVEGINEEKDIKKLIDAANTHLTKSAGSDELSKRNSELQSQLQDLKVRLDNKDKEVQSTIDELKKQSDFQQARYARNYEALTMLSSLNLTDAAKANTSRLVNDFFSPSLDKYEFKEENGKKVAYKDGVKQFKNDVFGGENSSEVVTMSQIIEHDAKSLGFIKSTDAKGGGDFGAPKVEAPPKEEINDPTGGIV